MDMKTAVSLPDPVFRSAEELAARLRISRSELYRRALEVLIAQHEHANITERLDAVYGQAENNSGLDPEFAALQSQAIRDRPPR